MLLSWNCLRSNNNIKNIFYITNRHLNNQPSFGFLFDIDGVIVRGKNVIPGAPEGFKRLVMSNNTFRIPTLFVTNSGNVARREKAEDLSNLLGIKILEEQIILSYSPLNKFDEYHDKRLLITGQGDIKEIAQEMGFKRIVTMDELIYNFPSLDFVDKNKRISVNGPRDKNFKKIDGIILLNEPTNWETSLQLIVDLLLTDGLPSKMLTSTPYPHILVIACNMDLLWVAKAPLPRFGHGAFLTCLENLYMKITGKELIYTALTGKPCLTTYCYANDAIAKHAKSIGINRKIEKMYAIGDNINTDVYGANLYNQYLKIRKSKNVVRQNYKQSLVKELCKLEQLSEACISILVKTGVHTSTSNFLDHHSARDFLPVEKHLCKPNVIVENVNEAIDFVLKTEQFY